MSKAMKIVLILLGIILVVVIAAFLYIKSMMPNGDGNNDITEGYYNSYLDITYPDENRLTSRPTLIYFHGGGFFGGSKNNGDPLAGSDATSLLDDICAEGFNLVTIDMKKG